MSTIAHKCGRVGCMNVAEKFLWDGQVLYHIDCIEHRDLQAFHAGLYIDRLDGDFLKPLPKT